MWQFDTNYEFFYFGSTLLNIVYYFFFYTLALLLLSILFKLEFNLNTKINTLNTTSQNKISKLFLFFIIISLSLLAGLPPMPTFLIKCFFLFKFASTCGNVITLFILLLFLVYWFVVFKFILNLFYLNNCSSYLKIKDLFNLTIVKFFLLILLFYFFFFISFLVII